MEGAWRFLTLSSGRVVMASTFAVSSNHSVSRGASVDLTATLGVFPKALSLWVPIDRKVFVGISLVADSRPSRKRF